MKHEILEQIWRARDEISSECGHDLKQLARMLRSKEKKYADRLVQFPKAKRKREATSSR
jgi:hypothetical protein